MDSKKFGRLLSRLGACSDARKWAKGKDIHEVWTTCERGDWLLWLCVKMIGKTGWPTQQQIVLAACACAAQSLRYVRKGDDRPRKAIETARKWAVGKATLEEVRAAADDAAYAAAYAAYAAAYAADDAYDAADAAAYAAAYAAYAAAYAADDAYDAAYAAAYAADDARSESLKRSAAIVRKMIAEPK